MNSSPTIAPDGKWIASVSGRYPQTSIWRMPANGGEAELITNTPAMSPRYSPDGNFIACFFTLDGKDPHKLVLLPAEGGEPVRSFSVSQTANLNLEWSRDGRSIYYRDWVSGIWEQDINGGDAETLSSLQNEEVLPFSWSRDGRQFAYTRGGTVSDVVLIGGQP